MERTVLRVSLTLVLAIVLVFVALAAREMGIITPGEKGTYYQFGLSPQSPMIVFPLYHEEIHILARLGIAEFDDSGRSAEPPSRG